MNEIDENLRRLAALNPISEVDTGNAETRTAKQAARARLIAASRGNGAAQSRVNRSMRVAVLAGLGALLLVGVGLVRGDGDDPQGDSFGAFAAIAAQQPSTGLQFVSWETQLLYDWPEYYAQGARYPEQVDDSTEVSLWFSDDTRYEENVHRYWDGEDKVVRTAYLQDLPSQTLCFGGFEGMPAMNCTATGTVGYAVDPQEDLGLPLEPQALRAALERQIEDPEEPPITESDCEASGGNFGIPIPYSQTGISDRSTLLTDLRAAAGLKEDKAGWTYKPPMTEMLFMTVTGMLSNPGSSPEFRAALFEVLDLIRGTNLVLDEEDRLGRDAVVIEYDAPPDERVAHDQVFVDPETSEVLEQRTTVEEIDGSADVEALGTFYRVFTEREEAAELPSSAGQYQEALDRLKAKCGSPSDAAGNP